MKQVEKSEGLTGMLTAFRKLTRGSRRIAFIGCPGWCNPFAELLGYVLRDAKREMVFIPNAKKEMARKVELTEYGMSLAGRGDPYADTVVLLGGLAMPEMGVDISDVKAVIEEVTEGQDSRRIIGVCIGGLFQKAGWDKIIDFDYLVDAGMDVVTYSRE